MRIQAVVVMLARIAILRILRLLDGTPLAILSLDVQAEKPAARFLKWKIGITIARPIPVMTLIITCLGLSTIAAQPLRIAGLPAAIAPLACARFLRAASRCLKDALLMGILARRDMHGS